MNKVKGGSAFLLVVLAVSAIPSSAFSDTLIRGYLPATNGDYKTKWIVLRGNKILQVRSRKPKGEFTHTLLTDDVIYPSLINLHNHTKQNFLPLWPDAQGQFANRFEWRGWTRYKQIGSKNWNPWIKEKKNRCAAFRFSELRAMVDGTSHLQGATNCVSNFAIHKVEDSKAYGARTVRIQATGDLLLPDELGKVYHPYIFPHIQRGLRYELAYKASIDDWFELNASGNPPRYVEFQHEPILRKKQALKRGIKVITHLGEGRRNDPYNAYEFELIQQLGLDLPGMIFIHGVGIDAKGFRHMNRSGMGLIWSPFSNLLLYGETVDIEAAKRSGITIAIGSDWAPTGSRSVLEELRIARHYLERMNLRHLFDDRELIRMATVSAAKLLGTYDWMGSIEEEKLANLILVRKNPDIENAYTNLVEAESKDVRLLMIDGHPIYGDTGYLRRLGQKVFERIQPIDPKACGFRERGFVQGRTKDGGPLDLDTYAGVQTTLDAAMLQRKEERIVAGHKEEFLVDPPTLFACDDPDYLETVEMFLESDYVLDDEEWRTRRAKFDLSGSKPRKLAEMFDLESPDY